MVGVFLNFKVLQICIKGFSKSPALSVSDELSQFLQYFTHNKEYIIINSIINYPDALSADHKYSINRQNTVPALKSCILNEFPT